MGLSIEEFARKHGLKLKNLTIEIVVSPYPRTILIPECPKCKRWIMGPATIFFREVSIPMAPHII